MPQTIGTARHVDLKYTSEELRPAHSRYSALFLTNGEPLLEYILTFTNITEGNYDADTSPWTVASFSYGFTKN